MGVHLVVLGAIATSAYTDLLPPLSAQKLLALTSLLDAPTLKISSPPVSALDARTMVLCFLRWDVYCCCASFVIWATYNLHQEKKSANFLVTLSRIAVWTVLGGPLASAVIFMWERDINVVDRLSQFEIEGKRK